MAKGKAPASGSQKFDNSNSQKNATRSSSEKSVSPELDYGGANLPVVHSLNRDRLEVSSLLEKFIGHSDDSRGFLALALFMIDAFERDRGIDQQKLYDALSAATSETIAITYQASANRMLELHFDKLRDKAADQEIRNDRMFQLLSREIGSVREMVGGEITELTNQVRHQTETQSFQRQVMVASASAIYIAVFAVIVTKAPELIGAFQKLLGH